MRGLQKKLIARVVATLLLVGCVSVSVVPRTADAFIFHDPIHTAVTNIVHGISAALQAVGNLSLGLPGTGGAAKAALSSASAACGVFKTAKQIQDITDNFTTVAVIAGSAGEIAAYSTKIVTLQALRMCYSAVAKGTIIASPAIIEAAGLKGATLTEAEQTRLNDNVLSLDKRIDDLKKFKQDAIKAMWKGVAVRVLMTAQRQITEQLVNEVVNRYKVSNYLDYADAVTSAVYTADYVNKNYADSDDQLILRSAMTLPGVSAVNPIVTEKTKAYLGVAPDDIDASDPNFYSKMARFGASKSSEYYVQSTLEAAADASKATARKTAEAEIAGGNGFVPVRNCANLTSQQRGFDLEQKRLQDLIKQDKEVLSRLAAQYQVDPKSVDQKAIQRAAEILNADMDKLKALPKSSKAFTQPCEAIQRPAKAVSDYTTAFLGSQLNAAAMPQDNNLPFGAALAEGWANSFLGNIITNKKVVNLLFENGYQSGNVDASKVSQPALQQAQFLQTANTESETKNGAFFTGSRIGAEELNQYLLTWGAAGVASATQVVILGPGLGTSSRFTQLNGTITVTAPNADAAFQLIVLDARNIIIATTVFYVSGNINPAVVYNASSSIQSSIELGKQYGPNGEIVVPTPPPDPPGSVIILDPGTQINIVPPGSTTFGTLKSPGRVAGARVSKPLVPIRGPSVQPRGE